MMYMSDGGSFVERMERPNAKWGTMIVVGDSAADRGAVYLAYRPT